MLKYIQVYTDLRHSRRVPPPTNGKVVAAVASAIAAVVAASDKDSFSTCVRMCTGEPP